MAWDAPRDTSAAAAVPSPTVHRGSLHSLGGTRSGAQAVGMVWSSRAEGSQAPAALMHLLIVVYTSGYNSEIVLSESIRDLTRHRGTSLC